MDEITRAIRCKFCRALDRITAVGRAYVSYGIEPVGDGWGYGAVEDIDAMEDSESDTYYCLACGKETANEDEIIEVVAI